MLLTIYLRSLFGRCTLLLLCCMGLSFASSPDDLTAANPITSSTTLPRIWGNDGKLAVERVASFRTAVRASYTHGLRPSDYGLADIERFLANPEQHNQQRDSALSGHWLRLAGHYLNGKVRVREQEPNWTAGGRRAELNALLSQAAHGESSETLLASLLPQSNAYQALVAELARLRSLGDSSEAAADLPAVTESGAIDNSTLKPGSTDPRVAWLRRRLGVQIADAGKLQFDEPLTSAVRDFQRDNALDADGIVGPATWRALQLSRQHRINAIRVNLERWRWLPETLGQRHVRVNIPAYRLRAVDNGATQWQTDVIVGRHYRQTPIFSSTIRYLVLNPSWTVPNKIAREDKLPQLKQNPSALAAQGFRVRDNNGQLRAVTTVDWRSVSKTRFPYTLYQLPGPKNALGRVKIMFPNAHAVYLHDTSQPELFRHSERAFSSGCVRVRNPTGLVDWLLTNNGIQRDALNAVWLKGTEERVNLQTPIAVHLLYLTTDAEADGRVIYYKDLYQRDSALLSALDAIAPI